MLGPGGSCANENRRPLPWPTGKPLRVAVVGAGIAGLSAAWLLSRRHEVAVYERAARIGGLTNAMAFALLMTKAAGGDRFPDEGVLVYAAPVSPNLSALLRHLDVATHDVEMSFSASIDDGRIEYAVSPSGLFAQRRNLLRSGFWRMLAEIVRFCRCAPNLLISPGADDHLTLGDYLASERYARSFVQHYLLPMAASIWRVPAEELLRFPAAAFVRVVQSLGLLGSGRRAVLQSTEGGAAAVLQRLAAPFATQIRYATGVRRITRRHGRVIIDDACGGRSLFDHVVIATAADQTLAMLADASADERDVLSALRPVSRQAVLHGDPALMPRRRAVWSSANALVASGDGGSAPVAVTYWLNRVLDLPAEPSLFLTLDPPRAPDPKRTHATFAWRHPECDAAALAARRRLATLQGVRNTWYCGHDCGDGVDEGALASGLDVGERLGGVQRPWRAAGVAVRS